MILGDFKPNNWYLSHTYSFSYWAKYYCRVIPAEDVKREKGVFSRDKLNLYLKNVLELDGTHYKVVIRDEANMEYPVGPKFVKL